MHTRFSCDAHNTMEEMCQASLDFGLNEIAITEHFDPHPGDYCPGFYRPEAYFAELARCRELFAGRLTIRAGLEVGDPHRFPAECRAMVRAWPYDFAIGSTHWIEDVTPFGRAYFVEREAEPSWRGYFAENLALARADDFDVMGHLDLLKREGTEYWGPFECEPHCDVLRETLRILIERGKGIEINTSGWRRSAAEPCPGLGILRWYAELGGEILTIGSDSHRTGHVALKREDAVALARQAGLRWLTTFVDRRPIQHALEE